MGFHWAHNWVNLLSSYLNFLWPFFYSPILALLGSKSWYCLVGFQLMMDILPGSKVIYPFQVTLIFPSKILGMKFVPPPSVPWPTIPWQPVHKVLWHDTKGNMQWEVLVVLVSYRVFLGLFYRVDSPLEKFGSPVTSYLCKGVYFCWLLHQLYIIFNVL